MTGEHVGTPLPEEQDIALGNTPPTGRHRGRRVTTPVPEGSDPNPVPEPERGTGTENDARLKGDKPPHWA